MKKLLLILASAAAAMTAQARELTFWLGDEKIEPGSSIEFTKPEVTDLGGVDQLMFAPELYISSDIYSSKIKVTAVCTTGQTFQMCCGGQCSNGTTVVKENVKVQTGQKLPLEFEYVEFPWMGGEYPTIVTEFEAQDGSYENTNIKFVLTMGPDGASVEAVEVDAPVRITSAGIVYNLPAGGTIELFSITGSRALKASLHGSGTLDTTSLKRGVYVYTLATPSLSRTGKLVVK